MAKNTSAIKDKLYNKMTKLVEKNGSKLKQCIGRFLALREESLYAIAPYDRIFFGDRDLEDFYKSIGITEAEVLDAIRYTYYYPVANFNPRSAKDPFTVAVLCIIRYYYKKKDKQMLDLSMIYLAFSGKFYPSVHYSSFPTVVPREYEHVMLYVVNNMLTNKFDLKREKTVIGAIRSICNTWLASYSSKFDNFDDEDVVYLLQQLRTRISSFMQNIADNYYDAYKNRDIYLTYDSDSLDEDSYHLADSDSLKAQRAAQNALTRINTSNVDYMICKKSSNENVKTDELKSILDTILTDNKYQPEVTELVNALVYGYYAYSKKKDVRDMEFISYSITAKPNSKDPSHIKTKQIIEGWLDETSPAYRKRKRRETTKNNYYKALLYYFVFIINEANL